MEKPIDEMHLLDLQLSTLKNCIEKSPSNGISKLLNIATDSVAVVVSLFAKDAELIFSQTNTEIELAEQIGFYSNYGGSEISQKLNTTDSKQLFGSDQKERFILSLDLNFNSELIGSVYLITDREIDKKHIANEEFQYLIHETANVLRREYELCVSRTNTNRMLDIINSTNVGTWEWHVQSGEVFINDRWANIIGYTKKELDPISIETWYNYVHPEDRPYSDEAIHNCLDGKTDFYNIDCRMIHKKGHVVWINDRGKVTERDSNGKPLVMTGVHVEITERIKSREKLQISEERFKSLVQDGSELIAVVNSEGFYSFVSPSYKHYLGYDEKELIDEKASQFLHPEEKEEIKEKFRELSSKKNVKTPPFRYKHKYGEYRWLQCSATNLLDKPEVAGVVLNSTDVTELMKTQNKLKKSEERYRGFYESQTNYVVRTDLKGDYTYVNKKFISEFGWIYPDNKIIGKPGLSSICEYHHELALETVQKCIKNPGTPIKVELDKPGPNSDIITTLWDFICLTNESGSPTEIQCMGIDITERTQFELALRESNERFEKLAKASSESIWDLNLISDELYLSDGFERNLGVDVNAVGQNHHHINEYLHIEDRKRVLSSFSNALSNPKIENWTEEYRFNRSNGSIAIVRDKAIIIRNDKGVAERAIGVMKDITTEYVYDKFDEIEKNTIELSMKPDVPFDDVLHYFTIEIEKIIPRMMVSIMAIRNNKLENLSSPSLPKAYIDSISGVEIGPNTGSCGTAAYEEKKVIVPNIFNDKRWEKYSNLGEIYGFKACWSSPIFDSNGKVVATFANYYKEVTIPSKIEQHIIERSERLISLLYNKFEYVEQIKKNNERYEYVSKATKDAIYDWDLTNDHFVWGEGFQQLFQHQSAPKSLAEWQKLVHQDDEEKTVADLKKFLYKRHGKRWTSEYRFQKADQTYSWVEEVGYLIRDQHSKPTRMIGTLRDITEEKQRKTKREVQHELSQFFKNNDHLFDTLDDTLIYLSKITTFEFAEVWLTSSDDKHINLVTKYASNQSAKKFHQKTIKTNKFPVDTGMPGNAWSKGETIIWNLNENDLFIRKKEALECGINYIAGIPIYHDNEVIGVLVFGSHSLINGQSQNFKAIEDSKHFLGAEIKRKQQENEMQLLFESAPEILGVASPDGHFVNVNPAFCNLLGYSKKELTSNPFAEFIHPNDLKATENEFEETKDGSRVAKNFINRYRTKSGEYKWISWNSSIPFGEDQLFFSFGRDITEVKELQTLLDNASKMAKVGGWEIDLTNDQMKWSNMTKEIHGLPADTNISLDEALKFYRDDVQQKVTEIVIDALTKGKPFDYELPIITANGNERWVRAVGNAEMLNGEPVRIYGSFQDIHERKQAEIELLRFKEVIKNSHDGIGIIDNNGAPIYVNPWFSKMLGHTAESMQKVGGPRAVYKNSNLADEIFTKLLNGKYWKGDIELINYKGETVSFHLSGGPIFNIEGEQIAAYGIHTDITKRKKAEKKIKESNERFELVTKTTNDAIWDWDAKNNHHYWGIGFKTIFGYRLSDPALSHWRNNIHPDEAEPVISGFNKALQNPDVDRWSAEYRFKRKNGKYANVIDRGTILRSKDGKAKRVVGAMTDITQRKQYEESLKRLNEELTDVAWTQSHVVRAPLAKIMGLVDLIKKMSYKELKEDQILEHIMESASEFDKIIKEIIEKSQKTLNQDNDTTNSSNTKA
ncbi:PAS domain S-box protein [Salibacter halophilus]|uniref:histidine kinase n=1 Tax=Salibacter halophilus TaxID=1803916 RepID=A0A6N6MAF0_9FLAO|nr:PAS domain S-box protein [Salibacter halophilus]KAB1065236.1 PAS domain S-box protein [Salibacter halophilus]